MIEDTARCRPSRGLINLDAYLPHSVGEGMSRGAFMSYGVHKIRHHTGCDAVSMSEIHGPVVGTWVYVVLHYEEERP